MRGHLAPVVLLSILAAPSCTSDYQSFEVGSPDAGSNGGGTGGAGATTSATSGTGPGSVGGGSVSGSTSASTGVGGCGAAVVDCDGDGVCETDIATDPDHCGACDHACSSDGVAQKQCVGGACVPICDPDKLDCKQPPLADDDDGCETGHDDKHCGGCDVSCEKTGHVCTFAGGVHYCVCDGNSDCGGMGAQCEPNGSCKCYPLGVPGFHCTYNEPCVGGIDCQCNGGQSCEIMNPGFVTVCCPAAGQLCVDLSNDPAHCGGCGVACPPSWTCVAGACQP